VCVLTFGCSSRAVYDNMQRNNRQECANGPPAQYDECLDRSSKSYEEYQRDRKVVLDSE
jgi:hypothetical protein